ncbi:5-deoxy-glucuronate isomerase [Tessaracoccus sp. MC1865]|uniref:5-deoxy-glucuronate isomerase n=1 Tax=Tessaracoccus sp. MC1865 TaxID=2760310 RepID=UPI00160168BE|nr:5-deoxy-glucuronate isomerase [Tessaracoccus sp. MC1865]MBB1484183.1 5-deoxy-glucuronate isomerase [Tessaracoccus sp. MC1865]QTO37205.1 5-deoxy-glucuronate isomerase [Tessaracoccus sp. MC1865]
MNDNAKYVIPAGETAHGNFETDVTAQRAGWEWCSIRVIGLPAGAAQTVDTGGEEILVLPLSGSCTVKVDGETHRLEGRGEVWTEITDYLYVPRGKTAVIHSEQGGRFALPGSKATKDLPVVYCPSSQVITTLRGTGNCSRQVNNYALGNPLETSHLLACEVLTPGGNWSSYPPHKHDEHTQDERVLEEIYYYEVRPGRDGSKGMALQRIYPSPGKPIDVCTEVNSRDVVVMPFGYHGPSVAAPGYDLYYLNVMAGPSEDSTWLMTDDPHYTWIRQAWEESEVDPRLPMTPLNPQE